MEELNLEPTYSRKTSSSAISAVGSDYEIESIFGVGGSEMYVNFQIFLFLCCSCCTAKIAYYIPRYFRQNVILCRKNVWGFYYALFIYR